ncbi:Ribosomal RNA small subunit methyltransferase H [Rosistilla carotiformis]|uniref:Ribosomal RNA small subunit methyltransferase H n=1 Tax=Rosistilla carotiformis TaxID=2528017 RepID=A0A518JR19_9BACT|nr:16S rRNA (cytosine(1402)-N(4))-methyltransferase RsmH [Rosistilla carotiformis]QDV67966.1 Ribosomal RNA small subunit methyltransferase H [Rosistilla carotiformis]
MTDSDSSTSMHVPVLPSEVIEGLDLAPGKTIIDGTFGGGGHARLIVPRISPGGMLIGMDRDPHAIHQYGAQWRDALPGPEIAGTPLPQIELINDSYHRIPQVLQERGLDGVDGILLDLGLSSDQLNDPARGFSYQTSGDLDLRFDPTSGEAARDLLLRLPEKEIADLIYQFGEERCSRRIARRIVERRKERRAVTTADELATLVRSCVPRSKNHRIDPATRTFQALRIAVNHELRIVKQALEDLPGCLRPGGRLAVISFHSLEDRIVKYAFREADDLEILTRKPLLASDRENAENPRARSAKLRVAVKKGGSQD